VRSVFLARKPVALHLMTKSAPQFDLLSIGPAKHDPSPAGFTRLSRGRIVRRADELDSVFLQLSDSFVEIVGLQTKMKSGQRFPRMMRQLKHRVAEPEIGDLQSSAGGVLKIVLKAKVALIKTDRSIKIRHVYGNVINPFKREEGAFRKVMPHLRPEFVSGNLEEDAVGLIQVVVSKPVAG